MAIVISNAKMEIDGIAADHIPVLQKYSNNPKEIREIGWSYRITQSHIQRLVKKGGLNQTEREIIVKFTNSIKLKQQLDNNYQPMIF
jgi:hypothetical protein